MRAKGVCLFHYRMFDSYGDLLGRTFAWKWLDLGRNNGELLLEVRGCPIWGGG